jgi:hypothetical protein
MNAHLLDSHRAAFGCKIIACSVAPIEREQVRDLIEPDRRSKENRHEG